MADTTLVDPLGRTIILHDATWYGHVILQHPDMRRYRDLAQRAITNPSEIRYSDADAECRIYFGEGPRKGIIVAVVANVVHGFVKTAHLIRKSKGTLEWSRPTR